MKSSLTVVASLWSLSDCAMSLFSITRQNRLNQPQLSSAVLSPLVKASSEAGEERSTPNSTPHTSPSSPSAPSAMDFWNPGPSGFFPCRSCRPRPVYFPSLLAFLTGAGCVWPLFFFFFFFFPSSGENGAGGGNGGSSEDTSSERALLAANQDDLQSTSSRDYSRSMAPSMGVDGSHAPIENYTAISMFPRRLSSANLQYPSSRYSSSSMGLVSSSASNPAVRGLLGFIITIAEKMILFYFGLATISFAYPLGLKAPRSFDDPWVRFICTASVISSFGSCFIAAFASHFKESESIGHVKFEIFIWLLFLELVAFIIEFCITLHIFARVSNWIVWPFGITGFCFITLTWVFYLERPKFLNKWMKDMWNKVEYRITPSVNRPPI